MIRSAFQHTHANLYLAMLRTPSKTA